VDELPWLTVAQFAEHTGTRFTASADDGVVELVLVEAQANGRVGAPGRAGEEREQFSLLFHGPSDPVLPQAITRLAHPALGALEIFLVPLGPHRDVPMRYEAVFA
jgi:hypothetical protein